MCARDLVEPRRAADDTTVPCLCEMPCPLQGMHTHISFLPLALFMCLPPVFVFPKMEIGLENRDFCMTLIGPVE